MALMGVARQRRKPGTTKEPDTRVWQGGESPVAEPRQVPRADLRRMLRSVAASREEAVAGVAGVYRTHLQEDGRRGGSEGGRRRWGRERTEVWEDAGGIGRFASQGDVVRLAAAVSLWDVDVGNTGVPLLFPAIPLLGLDEVSPNGTSWCLVSSGRAGVRFDSWVVATEERGRV